MKKLYTLFFCILSVSSYSQTDAIVGKWTFSGMTDSAKLDEKGKEMMYAFFGSMSMTFQNDGLYQSSMMGKSEYGFWNKSDSSTITLKTENGNETQSRYRLISEDRLELEIVDNAFILKREKITKIITTDSLKVLPPAVSITKEEAAQKWYYVNTINTTAGDHISSMANAFLEGAYIDLKSDSTFFQDMKLIQTEGTWRMVHDGKAFETTSEGVSQVFFIMKYESPYMTFLNPISGKQFLYSSEEPKE